MNLTKPAEMVRRAKIAIFEQGPDAKVGIVLSGNYIGELHDRRLFYNGPKGTVYIAQYPNKLTVLFKAAEVIETVRPEMLCPWCMGKDEAPCFYCESVGYLEKF